MPYKGQRFVIEALQAEKAMGRDSFVYQMVGGGNASALQANASQLGVEEQTVFLGSMPHEKVIEWLDTIDVYIQPSLQEGLPRALIEAMSRGLPCIGTNAGGTGELLEPDYIISTRRTEKIGRDIAAALERLCSPGEMERQAKRNFVEANANYIDTIIEKKRLDMFREFQKTF